MKKQKLIITLSIALVVVLTAAGVIWLKQYYDYRYALEDYYYTVVPLDYDFTPAISHNADGKPMGTLEANYRLVCYNADGKTRELEFRVLLDMHDLYPPETYVKVSASKQWATNKVAVPITDIPEKALKKIEDDYTPSSASSLAEYADERTRILNARAFPAADASCIVNESDLIYTYIYSTGTKEMALNDAELLDPVYKSQFRADKEAFPTLAAIQLIIKLDDGTELFSKKYNKRVEFGYEKK